MRGRRASALARRRRRTRWYLASLTSAALVGGVALSVDGSTPPAAGPKPPTTISPRAPTEVAVQGVTVSRPPDTTEPPRRPRRFTLAVTGDTLLHLPVANAAERLAAARGNDGRDFGPMFDQIRPLLRGVDLALCHLETPLSVDGENLSGYPLFNSAPEIAPALADAGYDGCSTASNHSYDRGVAGVRATLDHLDRAGIGHSGSARDESEAARIALYRAGEVTVAHLAYTTYLNGAHPNEPWMIDLATPDRVDVVAADAAAARAAGAEFVVASVHWGNEFQRAPSGAQATLADAITAIADVDLVVGHHAHVVQPLEQRNGKWVAFGLGNFLSNQHLTNCCPADSQDGVIVRFTVEERDDATGRLTVVAVDFTATFVDRDLEYTIVPVGVAISDPAIEPTRADEYRRSLERTTEAVRSSGATIEPTPDDVVLNRPSTGA